MSNRVQETDTSQHQLFRGHIDLHGRIAAKKPLLKDSNNNKRLAWAKKHKQLTLDRWLPVLWPDESKFEIFGSNRCVFVSVRGIYFLYVQLKHSVPF